MLPHAPVVVDIEGDHFQHAEIDAQPEAVQRAESIQECQLRANGRKRKPNMLIVQLRDERKEQFQHQNFQRETKKIHTM